MSDITTQPIGIYDSGIGGLTVLKTLQKAFPHERFVYFADTLHLPYGTKTKEQIISYTHHILWWLTHHQKVKMVVAACHTSSALAIDTLQDIFPIPVMGMIHPLLQDILSHSSDKRIGLLATPASILARTHESIFVKNGFKGYIHGIPCPDFVPLIEGGHVDSLPLRVAAEKYLEDVKTHGLDTLIYGCTHYPIIKPLIESLLPSHLSHIDPAYPLCEAVRKMLMEKNLMNKNTASILQDQAVSFYCSHNKDRFTEQIKGFMGINNPSVQKENIHTLLNLDQSYQRSFG